MRLNSICLLYAVIFATASLIAVPRSASAGGFGGSSPVYFFNEARLGVFAADLDPGGASDDTISINGELLTPPMRGDYADPILNAFLKPRFHLGTTFTTDDGVNQAYSGLTWDYHLTDALFLETSFGAAIHDGETDGNNHDSYGCMVQFRESLSVGIHLTRRMSVMAIVDHMSNAGLCDENQGLTNAGVRLGYRW